MSNDTVIEILEMNRQEIELIRVLRNSMPFGEVTIIMRNGVPFRLKRITEYADLSKDNLTGK